MAKRLGLSQVVSTVLLILLTVGAAAGIGAAVTSFVRTNLGNAGACNGIQGKLALNSEYTCYDQSSNKLVVSISRNDISLQSILVTVSNDTDSQGFSLTDKATNITNVSYYQSTNPNAGVTMPGNESGKTYCLSGFPTSPSDIQISPTISNVQCSVVDSLTSIPACLASAIAGC